MKKISCIAVALLLLLFVSAAYAENHANSESESNPYAATIAALQTKVVESSYTATPTPVSAADTYVATISALQTQIAVSEFTPTPTPTPTPGNSYKATIAALQTQIAEPDTLQKSEDQEASLTIDTNHLTAGETVTFGYYEQDNDASKGMSLLNGSWSRLTMTNACCCQNTC